VHKLRAHKLAVKNEYFIDLPNMFDRQDGAHFKSPFWYTEFWSDSWTCG